LHHGFLAADLTILLGIVDLVVVLVPATLGWGAVFALDLLGALSAIIVSTSSVDGASLIGDLVLVHPLEGVISLTTVATIITRARDEHLRSDVDIWPSSIPGDLNSIRECRGGGVSPA